MGIDMQLINDDEVARVLTWQLAHDAVRRSFEHRGSTGGDTGLLHLDHDPGEFHIKAGFGSASAFAVKLNAAYPDADGRLAIRGAIVLFDAEVGRPLAVLASKTLTRVRTAANTVMAVGAIRGRETESVAIVGQGNQASAHVDAFVAIHKTPEVRIHARDRVSAEVFLADKRTQHPDVHFLLAPSDAPLHDCPVVVTCTNATAPIVNAADVDDVCVVVGVGADSPGKWELATDLLSSSRLITDLTNQCENVGDLQHAIASGAMTRDDVFAELADVVVGRADPEAAHMRVVFDSTGTGFQDAAAARCVYDLLHS